MPRGGYDRGPGGVGEAGPEAALYAARTIAAMELARAWAQAAVGVEPDATNYPGRYSSYAYSVAAEASAAAAAAAAQAAVDAHEALADPHPGLFAAAVHSHGLFDSATNGFVPASGGGTTNYLRADGTWAAPAGGGGGVTDHGALTGLADDDHTQYHNDTRGDARYSLLAHTHNGITTTWAETPPVSPAPTNGDRWIKASSGTEYTYINDGDSSQWVETGGSVDSGAVVAAVSFSATRTGTEQNSGTTLLFNNEVSDVGAGYNSSTGIFTCPVDGTYYFAVSAQFTNSTGSTNGHQVQLEHSVEGVVAAESASYPTGTTYSTSTSVEIAMLQGETMKVTTNVALSGTFVLTNNARTRFTGRKIT